MKPKKKTTKYVLIAVIILLIAAFGLIDFRGLFKSEPTTAPEQPEANIETPETFVSEQKVEEIKGENDQKADNIIVPDTSLTDKTESQDSPSESSKPPTQDYLPSQNSEINPPADEQKPAIVETDIKATDDKTLAKAADSTLSKATDETPDKPVAMDAALKSGKPEASTATLPSQNKDISIMGEGPSNYPYSIQLASFNKDNHAVFKKAFKKFQKEGLAPFWVKVDLGSKGVWHRVLTGCFRQKSEAREVVSAKNLDGVLVANTKFAVRIGEYKDTPALRQMLTSLETKGYSPYIIKKNSAKYVLYVGAFYSRKVAQKTVDELAVKGVPSEAVLR